MTRLFVTLGAALLLISSCASLSEDQCRAGDWAAIGRADGAEGRGPERLEAHARACADFGIAPDAAAWARGREQGLRLYCTPAKAYEVGRSGRQIAPGCVQAELAAMRPAHRNGLAWHRVSSEIDEVEREIDAIERRLEALGPDDPSRPVLIAQRARMRSELRWLDLERLRYEGWP